MRANSTGRYQRAARLAARAMAAASGESPEDQALRARVLVTTALTELALSGRQAALSRLDEARKVAQRQRNPVLTVQCNLQQAAIHVWCAEWPAAIECIAKVRPHLQVLSPQEQCAALLNGGLAHASQGDVRTGQRDLERARTIATAHQLDHQVFKATHNLGCLAYIQGDIPRALIQLRQAREMHLDVNPTRTDLDLAQVLLDAGLLSEAEELLTNALAQTSRAAPGIERGDVYLDLARCAVLQGQYAVAARRALAAARVFGAHDVADRQRQAQLTAALIGLGQRGSARRIRHLLAEPLHPEASRTTMSLHLRLLIEQAVADGHVDLAAAELARLRRLPPEGTGDALHRLLLRAQVASAIQDRAASRRALRQAARLVTRQQGATSSLEIRAGLAVHSRRLREFDIGEATRSGSLPAVLDSAERWRASSYLTVTLAPDDDELRIAIRRLRGLRQQLTLAGPEAAKRIRQLLARSEADVSTRARELPPTSTGTVGSATTHRELRRSGALESHDLITYHSLGSTLWRCTLTAEGMGLDDLGPVLDVQIQCDQLSEDLADLMHARAQPAISRVVRASVMDGVRRLDATLLDGLRLDPSRTVVVVPTGTLLTAPWRLLPALRRAPIVVSPSLTRWMSLSHSDLPPTDQPRRGAGRRGIRLGVVAGPGLEHSQDEVEFVAAQWTSTRSAKYPHGTVADVHRAFATHELVHIAAHGTHAEGNPLFSSIHLCDGQMLAHELARRIVSRHVVLSACDVGRAHIRDGDEPLGFAAALLARGAESVVAAVAPVADDMAFAGMSAYHRALASGQSAATALRDMALAEPDLGAFTLFGADWSVAPLPTAGC